MSSSRLSPSTAEALAILSASIRRGRLERGWTLAELAERVGTSVGTMRSVERGQSGVAIGTVLEAATLVGTPLFHTNPTIRSQHLSLQHQALALLPGSARPNKRVDDDF